MQRAQAFRNVLAICHNRKSGSRKRYPFRISLLQLTVAQNMKLPTNFKDMAHFRKRIGPLCSGGFSGRSFSGIFGQFVSLRPGWLAPPPTENPGSAPGIEYFPVRIKLNVCLVQRVQWRIQGRGVPGTPPPDQECSKCHAVLGKIGKIVYWRPWRVGAPSCGECWIRPLGWLSRGLRDCKKIKFTSL